MRILLNDFCGHAFPLQLSRALAADGHEVHHLYFAGNNTPKGPVARLANDPPTFSIRGLTIGVEFQKHSVLKRRRADLAYGQEVANCVARFRPDALISSNMPLDAQRLALNAARRYHSHFVFWLQDIYSSAIGFVLRQKHIPLAALVAAFYRRLEKKLLRESDSVVCIAPRFLRTLADWGIDKDRAVVIPNWAPLDEIKPVPKRNLWAREHGLCDRFCFMYSGTLGMKHNPNLLLKLAESYSHDARTAIVVIADGAGADWLREQAKSGTARALHMLPFQPYARLSEVLGTADILVSILDRDCGEFAVPSKTFSYLCAGRPLLVAAPEQNLAARMVFIARAGVVANPGDADVFVHMARRLAADANWRRECAANARSYAERTFAIDTIKAQFLSVLQRAGCQKVVRPTSGIARSLEFVGSTCAGKTVAGAEHPSRNSCRAAQVVRRGEVSSECRKQL